MSAMLCLHWSKLKAPRMTFFGISISRSTKGSPTIMDGDTSTFRCPSRSGDAWPMRKRKMLSWWHMKRRSRMALILTMYRHKHRDWHSCA